MLAWRSNVLKNYGRGWIVAAAHDVATARDLVRREFDAFARERWHYLDVVEIAEKREEMESDIADDPVPHGVLFIMGSD